MMIDDVSEGGQSRGDAVVAPRMPPVVESGAMLTFVIRAVSTMPRISHKKATALSCVSVDAALVTRLAEEVADILADEIGSGSGGKFSSCSVAAAVARALPVVTCPLQPRDLLQRCATLHLPLIPPDDSMGGMPCVASSAAAYIIMWSLMLEGVGDVVQRGLLKLMAESSHQRAVERAGRLVLMAVKLPEEEENEEEEHSSFAGLPASIDLLLSDDIGGKLLADHRDHVIMLLSKCAQRVVYCKGSENAVNADISPAGAVTLC